MLSGWRFIPLQAFRLNEREDQRSDNRPVNVVHSPGALGNEVTHGNNYGSDTPDDLRWRQAAIF